ncbi:MAG: hypothetical protein D1H97_16285 [Paracoccus sp. BP8]|nr:MAG: hypothetical protein D1H97_16285 [Paracoccus sp. BP8]
MSVMAFLSAVLALLIAPGPTNTLMGLAGAQKGLRAVLRLMPAELLGYLAAILPLAWLGAGLLERWPAAAVGLKLVAALWVMLLAVRLWGRGGEDGAGDEVTARRVWLTTVLNPKALIFGLVLLPAPADPGFAPRLALFCAMVVAAALLWGSAGTLARIGDRALGRLRVVQRLASAWLAAVSVTLIAGVIGA